MKDGWESDDCYYVGGDLRGAVRVEGRWLKRRWVATVRPGYRVVGRFWRKVNAQRAVDRRGVR